MISLHKNVINVLSVVLTAVMFTFCSKDTDQNQTQSVQKFWLGDTTKIAGIDISHHQGTINWFKVKKSGINFVFVKATEGKDYLDSMFTTYWNELENENIIRGAYHFYSSDDDPLEQANWFVGNVKNFKNALPPVLDIERKGHKNISPDTFEKGVLECLTAIEKLCGKKPIIYSSPHFADKYLFDKRFEKYLLWIADYDVEEPQIPSCWRNVGWHFWQHTNIDSMPGISTDVDHSFFSQKIESLLELAKD